MPLTRREFGTAMLVGTAARAADPAPRADLGLVIYSFGTRARAEKEKGFSDPVRFIEFARERGATAVQVPLGTRTGAEAAAVRKAAEMHRVVVEGIISPPVDDRADLERFTAELASAKASGASVVRTVLSAGRRYETFTKAEDYPALARRAAAMLRRAEPAARGHGVGLAVENHKDFRSDELADLLKGVGSEFVGVCVDTGNSLALLEQPADTIRLLAPFALTVHLKDMRVEEAPDGFRLSEVPLGEGILDLKAVVTALRAANPRVRFQLEMITRDPLPVPCLTEKYWATLGGVSGRDLARTLALVRSSARKEPLPRVSTLPAADLLAREEQNVRACFAFAAKSGLFPPP